MSCPDHRLLAAAERQLGLVTRSQALACGLSDRQLHRRVAAGRLVRVMAGVYGVPGVPDDPQRRCLAACLAIGPPVAVSHRSAAVLWGLLEDDSGPVQVTVPRRRGPERPGVVVHRAALPVRPTRLGPVPVLDPGATLLSLGSAPDELAQAVDEALRRRLVRPDRLLRRLEASRAAAPLKGILVDRAVLGVPESVLETKAVLFFGRFALPQPTRGLPFDLPARRGRVDFAYRDERLAIEFDGRDFHTQLLQREDDRLRQNELEKAGWRVLRFTWRDLAERPTYVAVTIAEALGIRPRRWTRPTSSRPGPARAG